MGLGMIDNFSTLLEFVKESDKLKNVNRKTSPIGLKRKENSAEHSWSLCLMAMLMADFSNEEIDLLKVVKMLIIHDLPEIYAGDLFVYAKNKDSDLNEKMAANKLFSRLPDNVADEFLELWEEFEAGETVDARYANALDRFQPCFCNFSNAKHGSNSWKELGISPNAVLKRNKKIKEGSETMWRYVEKIVKISKEKGYFPKKEDVRYD